MTRSGVIATVVTAALVASPVLARKERVPIEGSGKVIIVEATINQRVTGRFLLDTGASYCVISKETASSANLAGRKDGRKIRLATASGAMMEATIGEARRIEIGDAVARDVEVAVVDGNPFPGFHGLIGLSFLQRFKYSIDSRGGVLLLEN
jgi:clan AA aspartic protease (TIGR02281 family)